MKMKLQYFADPEGGEPTPPQPAGSNEPTDPTSDPESTEPELKYTDEDVDKIVQKKLAKAEAKQQKAVKEAEKLAKMNNDQKRQYELEKLQEENEAMKKSLARNDMAKTASGMLADRSIVANDKILGFVVRDTAEDTQTAVTDFISVVEQSADALYKQKLKGTTPRVGGENTHTMTKDEIMKINNPVERQKKIQENMDLFI